MKKLLSVLVLSAVTFSLFAVDLGSAAAEGKEDLSLEEMLQYALEDEYMALAEYEALIKTFDLTRPYSNIAESERAHISYLEELYRKHDIRIPEVDTEGHLLIPSSPAEAAAMGVEAEIRNIAMYKQFLGQRNLPEDVREVFVRLMRASENHKRAFERQIEAGGGRGRRRG